MRDILKSIDDGTFVEPSKMTLDEYLNQWLKHCKGQIEQTSLDMYTSLCKNHIIPKLGKVRLQKVTPVMIQDFYADELENGRMNAKSEKKGLSPTTVKHIHTTLHTALEHAVNLGLLATNPCQRVKKPRRAKKETASWTPEEAWQFIQATESDKLHSLFVLVLGTGLRRGEVLGLKWDAVNLDNGTITVKT